MATITLKQAGRHPDVNEKDPHVLRIVATISGIPLRFMTPKMIVMDDTDIPMFARFIAVYRENRSKIMDLNSVDYRRSAPSGIRRLSI